MKPKNKNNIAFVDGQNLYLGTTKCYNCAETLGINTDDIKQTDCTCGIAWRVNLAKFRIYLRDKYHVTEAYYFLGNLQESNDELYKAIQRAGFIIQFKEHHPLAQSKKKGNVDTDIVFEIMKQIIDNEEMNKIILISGDGDYKRLVDYLIKKNRFCKLLFPNKKFASSLYNELGSEYFDYLENIKKYIA